MHLHYAFSLLILCSGILSFIRNQDWRDEISLWSDNAQKYPASFRSWNNLGTAYIKSGQVSLAEEAFAKALTIARDYPPARVNLAILWKDQGRLDEAYSLIEGFRETKIGSFSAEVYYNMGSIFAKKGVLDWAIFHYGQAVNRLPNYAEAHFNLALVYRRAGKKLEAKQSFQLFLEHWRGPSDSPFVVEAKTSIKELGI
jgi:tetratricopeptide (TPR) repeat protein